MIKKLILGMCFCSMLLLGSCAGTEKIVFDDSVPLENSAWISSGSERGLMNSGDKIVSYNGVAVDWDISGLDLVRIPAGETLLEWNVDGGVLFSDEPNHIITGEGLLMQFNFQPARKYLFYLAKKDDVYGYNVYEFQFEENMRMPWNDLAKHRVGFAPFLNLAGDEKTILN